MTAGPIAVTLARSGEGGGGGRKAERQSFKELLALLSAEHDRLLAENERLEGELRGDGASSPAGADRSSPSAPKSSRFGSLSLAAPPPRGIAAPNETSGNRPDSPTGGARPLSPLSSGERGRVVRAPDQVGAAVKFGLKVREHKKQEGSDSGSGLLVPPSPMSTVPSESVVKGRKSSVALFAPTAAAVGSSSPAPAAAAAQGRGGGGPDDSDAMGPVESMDSAATFTQGFRRRVSNRMAALQHLYPSSLTKESPFLINPERSVFLAQWDNLMIACLAFVAVVAPIQISMLETDLNLLFVMNCIVDMIFFVDVVLQFFMMYKKKTEYGYTLERQQGQIVKHYLKTWFAIDFICVVPYDLVGLLAHSQEMERLKIVKTIRVLRLLKLARMFRASRVFHRFEVRMSITYGRLALVKFFVIMCLITHWLANLWALTLVLVEEGEGWPRWIDGFTELERNNPIKTKDTPWKLYITCLYFTSYTITSVGYGDIGPANIVETVVATIMIVISGISWAVVLGQVCGIVANLDKDEQAFRSTMDELNLMMRDRVMPREMRRRLRSFFLSNKTAQRRARHQRIITSMSPGLQGEVVMEINRKWLEKVSFLSHILEEADSPSYGPFFYAFVVDVSKKMQLSIHAQSEVFGSPQILYILNRGLVSRVNRVYTSGAVWGSDFVLSDKRLVEPYFSFALTYAELTTLTRETFLDLVDVHKATCPELRRMVRRHCCWLAFQRALLKEAGRRKLKLEKSMYWNEHFSRQASAQSQQTSQGGGTPKVIIAQSLMSSEDSALAGGRGQTPESRSPTSPRSPKIVVHPPKEDSAAAGGRAATPSGRPRPQRMDMIRVGL